MIRLMSSSAEHLANRFPSRAFDRAWLTRGATWPSSILAFLTSTVQHGASGKTSPVSCHQTEDGTLVPSSGRWANSGMGSPSECWTLNSLESRNDAEECSLSAVLETGDLPQRYLES